MSEEYMEIDVQKIMQEIREDIRKRDLDGSLMAFGSTGDPLDGSVIAENDNDKLAELNQSIKELNQVKEVSLDTPLLTRSGTLGKVELFVKNSLRKVSRFILYPIVTDQNFFNNTMARSMRQMRDVHLQDVKELQEEIKKLKERIQELEGHGKENV